MHFSALLEAIQKWAKPNGLASLGSWRAICRVASQAVAEPHSQIYSWVPLLLLMMMIVMIMMIVMMVLTTMARMMMMVMMLVLSAVMSISRFLLMAATWWQWLGIGGLGGGDYRQEWFFLHWRSWRWWSVDWWQTWWWWLATRTCPADPPRPCTPT